MNFGWRITFGMTMAATLLAVGVAPLSATTLQAPDGAIRIEIAPAAGETVSIRQSASVSPSANQLWTPALSTPLAAMRVTVAGTPDAVHTCHIGRVSQIAAGVLVKGTCGVGKFEEKILLSDESDTLTVEAKFTPARDVKVRAVEDRYNFAPGRRASETPVSGPVDFVWSQNIKNEADDIIPNGGFKSPAVMLQQGSVFTALMPRLSDGPRKPVARGRDAFAMDLDVTSEKLPWLSYGAMESQPYGHSYFRRSPDQLLSPVAGSIQFAYSIVASSQPEKLGYRTVVRKLWQHTGHKELMRSNNLQQNVVRKDLVTFDQWRADIWNHSAESLYHGFDCGGRHCGTLTSNRSIAGQPDEKNPDAWFNAWFQTLRTAYGWYLYGRNTGNRDIQNKAESVLTLALRSPQNGGAFPTIYFLNSKRWMRDQGWAGFADDYHAMSMSWTAYWMLQWAENLTPGRKAEVLSFVRPYGDFLVQHQLASGVIPAWFDANLKPIERFRDFNAETSVSALFLTSLAEETGNPVYLQSAKRAMNFIQREVVPRQRWFDFETFISCARKPWNFYDPWTAQYPQNNLAAIQAAEAYLELFRATKDPQYLTRGTQVLDYLLLTQQVWNNPAWTPKVIGGFTTQNTDAEWSDARQGYAAIVLFDYYRETGSEEYLERSVGAARATFAIAPWENWAHTGQWNQHGALSSFHWGSGSAMTTVEMMAPTLGDAFIDAGRKQGVGFNACSLRRVAVNDHTISFDLETFPVSRKIRIRFAGIDPGTNYQISWNGRPPQQVAGETLARDGYLISR